MKIIVENYGRFNQKYLVLQWLILTIGFIVLMFLAAIFLPLRSSVIVIVIVGVGCTILSFVRPFYGLVILLSIQPVIFIIKRLQFMQAGMLAEFNNPISLLPQIVLISIMISIFIGRAYRNEIRRPPFFFFLTIAIISAYSINVLLAPSITAGIFGLRAVIFQMLLIFVGRSLVKTKHQLQYILSILSVISVIVGAYALKQSLVGFFPFEYNWAIQYAVGRAYIAWFIQSSGQVYLRAFSTLGTPFDLAGVSMLAPFLLLPLYLSRTPPRYVMFIFSFLVVLGSLIATGVRGAWVGFIIAASVSFIYYSRKILDNVIMRGVRRVIVLVYIFVFIITAIALTQDASSPILVRLQSLGGNFFQTGNMLSRYGIWAEAFEGAVHNPFGHGTGSSGYISRRFGNVNALTPDSIYVQALIELGWLGVLLFLALFITSIIYYSRQYYTLQNIFLRNVNLAIIAIIVAIFIHGFTTPLQETQMTISWFWLFLGIGTNLKKMDNSYDE